MRLTSCVASSECPPNSKKLSSSPTRSTFNTSAISPHTISSCGVRGALHSFPLYSGSGNARRSIFPFAVSGISSNTMITLGTMYPGSFSPSRFLNSPPSTLPSPAPSASPTPSFLPPPPPTTYPTNLFSPLPSPFTTTAACSTPSSLSSAASISPNSTRYPLTFTCWSTRPINSSRPSLLHLTTSPVRYIRSPLPPYGFATNRSAVNPPLFQYPRPNPAPPIYNSPLTPIPHIFIPSSSTYTCVFAIGPPIGTSPLSPSSLLNSPQQLNVVPSVGPYPLINLHPLSPSTTRLTSPAPSTSPPANSCFTPA